MRFSIIPIFIFILSLSAVACSGGDANVSGDSTSLDAKREAILNFIQSYPDEKLAKIMEELGTSTEDELVELLLSDPLLKDLSAEEIPDFLSNLFKQILNQIGANMNSPDGLPTPSLNNCEFGNPNFSTIGPANAANYGYVQSIPITSVSDLDIIRTHMENHCASIASGENEGPTTVARYYYLTQDLVLPNNFEPLGFSFDCTPLNPDDSLQIMAFHGMFDGQGHTISNFNYQANDEDEQTHGFFRVLAGNVVNLRVKNFNVEIENGGEQQLWAGTLAGWISGGKVDNVIVEDSSVKAYNAGGLAGIVMAAYGGSTSIPAILDTRLRNINVESYGGFAGGLSSQLLHAAGISGGGNATAALIVRKVSVTGSVKSNGNSSGGLAGRSTLAEVVNSCTKATVISTNATASTGGLIGEFSHYAGGPDRSSIAASYALGETKSPGRVGGAFGRIRQRTVVDNVYSRGQVELLASESPTDSSYVGGFVGEIEGEEFQITVNGASVTTQTSIINSYSSTEVLSFDEDRAGGYIGKLLANALNLVAGGIFLKDAVESINIGLPAIGLTSGSSGTQEIVFNNLAQMKMKDTYLDLGWLEDNWFFYENQLPHAVPRDLSSNLVFQ